MKKTGLFISVSAFSFLSFLRRAIFYAFFYVYLRSFLGLSNTLSALLGTANLSTSIFGQLKLWGPRLNKDPNLAKKYVVRGEVIAGIVYLIAFLGHRIVFDLSSPLFAALFLISCTSFLEIFWSGSDLGIRKLQSIVTEGKDRGRLVGTIDGIGLFGQLLGFIIGGVLYQDGMGFFQGNIFYIVSFLIFLCALVIFLSPEGNDIKAREETSGRKSNLKEVFQVPSFGGFIIILGILIMGLSASTQTFLYYVTDESALNFSDETLSILLIFFSISGGLIAPIAGKLSDLTGRLAILILASLFGFISYLFLFLAYNESFLNIAILYAVLGGATSIIQSISFAYSADLLPMEFEGTGFGIFNITLATGWGLAGFLIGGPIADIFISLGEINSVAYRFSFLGSSVLIFSGMLCLVVFSIKQYRKE
ncbi:MAG: MFS transporter [Candidatus Hodarchaeales archaeon]